MMKRIFNHALTILLLVGFLVLALGSATSPQSGKKIIEYQRVSSLSELDLESEGKGYIVEAYLEYYQGAYDYGLTLIDDKYKLGPITNFHGGHDCRYHNEYSCQNGESYYFSHWADAAQQFRPRIDNNIKYTIYIGVYNGSPSYSPIEQPYIDKIEGLETLAEITARRNLSDVAFGQAGTPNNQEDFDVRQNAQGGITITGYKGTRRWVIIPDTLYGQKVTEIGAGVFSDKNLTNIEIPNTVTHIRFRAFYGNNLLTNVVIPDTLLEIEDAAFTNCGLTSLRLGSRIQTIGFGAFGRNKIETLIITSTNTNYRAQTLFGEIVNSPFEDNPLTRVTLPANISDSNVRNINADLGTYYISQGKRAGTYVKNGPVWARE